MTKNLSTTLGKQKAELVFKNAKVVNVFTKEIITTDVAVNGEVIVGTNNKYSGLKEIDCKGKYLVPGLIDPHIHLCSSLTTPRNFMSVATNHGVCTVIADPHEITNVYGHEGLKYYMSDARLAVGNIYFALPSCVPASDYEEANVVFKVDDLARYINLPEVVALGEMMNINGVLDGNKDVLAKIELFKKHHKVIDGHSPLLTKHQLQAYISTGITTNHEATHYWEIKEHLQNGIYIFLRHASYAFVADQELVKLFRSGMSLNRCCWCTDDKTVADVQKTGLIDYSIRRAIKLGLSPIEAICMGTINPAACYGLRDQGGIAAGYQANILILDNLQKFNIIDVYFKGKKISKFKPYSKQQRENNRRFYSNVKVDYEVLTHKLKTIKLTQQTECIKPLPNSILTKAIKINKNNKFIVNKVVNIERHKHGKKIGAGWVVDFNITNGALATTIGHDSHNITAIGSDDSNLILAIKTLQKIHGGYVVVKNNKVIATLPLPIGGLFSDDNIDNIIKQENKLNNALNQVARSHNFNNPFLTMSFLSLTVIPEIRITTTGLYKMKS